MFLSGEKEDEMRAVVQRVRESHVTVNGQCVGRIARGALVLVGVQQGDAESDMRYIADKILHLRIFEDDAGKMNRSVLDVEGSLLVISQFTLLGDCRKGRRPSFIAAEHPERAKPMFDELCQRLRSGGVPVETGVFGADMQVHLINDGPVTLWIDSR